MAGTEERVFVSLNKVKDGVYSSNDVDEIADRALEELAPILAASKYKGDIDTALVHHMGREAFQIVRRGSLNNYFELAARIGEHAGRGVTPLLLSSQIENGSGDQSNIQTTLAVVNADNPTFRSETLHERDMYRLGFTDKIAVISRTLSLDLIDDPITVQADLTNRGPVDAEDSHSWRSWSHENAEGLVLHKTTQIDGHNGKEIPETDIVENSQEEVNLLYGGLDVAVGWQNVAKALRARINAVRNDRSLGYNRNAGDAKALEFTFKMIDFFEASGRLDSLQQHNKPLAEIIDHALGLRYAFHRSGPPDFIL